MIHRSRDVEEVRRATAILILMDGIDVSETAAMLSSGRSSVYRWAAWYNEDGIVGLRSEPRGRSQWTVTEDLITALRELLAQTPRALGYLRSSWSSELLAQVLRTRHALAVHASTLRRLLPRIGYGWRRARPTLCIRDPRKSRRLQAIRRALAHTDPETEVFFVDEADIDLNPRIGFLWQRRGQQAVIPTPGQNRKRYLAGALNARTGRLVWTDGERKDTGLFLGLLRALRAAYRRARRIVLVLDNYIIHRSRLTCRWLSANHKFKLLFQPAYHPWVNRIERLWKQLHDTVTRNHGCESMPELMGCVARFMEAVQPFPGAGHGVAQFGSAI
jgi:transposase